ncbi:MAG: amino acid ABC transporter permease [Clostridium sp.]
MVKYIYYTFEISIFSLIIGISIGSIVAAFTYMNIGFFKSISRVWISFFRGTPLIAQLFFFYFGVAQVIPSLRSMTPIVAAIITIGFNSSAYMAEGIRGALISVDKGQVEAYLSLGMNKWQGFRYIIYPQAIRVAIPSLFNSLSDIVKGSSLAFTIGVTEIMATAQMEGASNYRFLESYTAVILLYWIISIGLTYIQDILERRLSIY